MSTWTWCIDLVPTIDNSLKTAKFQSNEWSGFFFAIQVWEKFEVSNFQRGKYSYFVEIFLATRFYYEQGKEKGCDEKEKESQLGCFQLQKFQIKIILVLISICYFKKS